MPCDKLNGYPMFPDGRKFCTDTIPQGLEAGNLYNIVCKCDNKPDGCVQQLFVFTDAVEAVRDNFWGKSCKANNITITVSKI